MKEDVTESRKESGCIHFDLLRDQANPCKFGLYEVWASPEVLAAHMELPHVKAWGAFQYGDKKPVVSKAVMKAKLEDYAPSSASGVEAPVGLILQVLSHPSCPDYHCN